MLVSLLEYRMSLQKHNGVLFSLYEFTSLSDEFFSSSEQLYFTMFEPPPQGSSNGIHNKKKLKEETISKYKQRSEV